MRRFARSHAALASLILSVTMAGCSTTQTGGPPDAIGTQPPASPAQVLVLQGQLSVKLQATPQQAAQGTSLGFFFSGQPQAGQLDLMTPLGSQLARVRWDASGASLQRSGDDEGQGTRFAHLDELTAEVLGEALPLATLIHWMQGRPDPSLPAQPGASAGTFHQLDWLIDTREMPRHRLTASRPDAPRRRGALIKVYLDH